MGFYVDPERQPLICPGRGMDSAAAPRTISWVTVIGELGSLPIGQCIVCLFPDAGTQTNVSCLKYFLQYQMKNYYTTVYDGS